MDDHPEDKAVGPATEPEGNPAYSGAKEAYEDPIHDHPDPAISGEPVPPDWVPEGPAFPTDPREIDAAFGEMTDAKKALMRDVKVLIYTRTKSPALCIEMAFLLMGSSVKAVETGSYYAPEVFLDVLTNNSHLWQSMLLRRVHSDLKTLREDLEAATMSQKACVNDNVMPREDPVRKKDSGNDGPDRELTGVK